jgi:hypothetical protein
MPASDRTRPARRTRRSASCARFCAPLAVVALLAVDVLADEPGWWPGFRAPGVNGDVLALTLFEGNLIAAGRFTTAGQAPALHIARWDGAEWIPLGLGLNDDVYALAVYDDELYAAGRFTGSGSRALHHVARWDGFAWQPLAEGVDGDVMALTVHAGALVVGGEFDAAGGTSAGSIARWDGSTWQTLGTGVSAGGSVLALASFAGELVAAGRFDTIDEVAARSIARWDGARWQPLGTGVDRQVTTLTVFDGQLVVGGSFSEAGGIEAQAVATWDGSEWHAFGPGITGSLPTTRALASYAGQLIAAGSFIDPTAVPPNTIVGWNGTSWNRLGAGMDGGVSVFALVELEGHLFAGGSFTSADGRLVNRIAVFDGSSWQPVSTGFGMSGVVRALHLHDGSIVVAGTFDHAGSTRARSIARWDGADWQPLGVGLPGTVLALASYHGELIAGGSFLLDDQPAAIARWDGARWSSLGGGLDGPVVELAVYRDNLYAVGRFSRAGDVDAAHIARWDGSAWDSLNLTLDVAIGDPMLNALAVHNDELVVAGRFNRVNQLSFLNIARWNESSWHDLEGGVDEVVDDLVVHDGDLYVAGFFNFAGGIFAPQLARWDGRWHAMGAGLLFDDILILDPVLRLHSFEGDLVLAGRFDGFDGVRARNIARWTGQTWSPFESGTDAPVLALADAGGELFVGGRFGQAGRVASSYIARWDTRLPALRIENVVLQVVESAVLLRWALPEDTRRNVTGVRILRSQTRREFTELPVSPLIPAPSMEVVDTDVAEGNDYWYRIVLVRPDGSVFLVSELHVLVEGLFRTRLLAPLQPVGAPIQVRYSIGEPRTPVEITLFDVRGRYVRTLERVTRDAGLHVVLWNRTNVAGRRVGRGVYLLRFKAGVTQVTRKVVLLHD